MRLAIEWAEHFEDLDVKEAGRTPNDGAPSLLFMRGDRLPWCAGFVLTCLLLAGKATDYWALREVSAFEADAKRRGKWFAPSQVPCRGDVVFFHGRSGSDGGPGRHCGFVKHVDDAGDIITVEGNVGDAIKSRQFSPTDRRISGFARY